MKIGIDASNIGGGGGVTHLKELLISSSNKDVSFLFDKIYVFSSSRILDQLPDIPNVEKINFKEFNGSIFRRFLFQLFLYDKEIKNRCDILFSITGDYLGGFRPLIGMSRNMLLYDRTTWKEMGSMKERSRFYLNYLKQKRCFANSDGIIFISRHAKMEVNRSLFISDKIQTIIHHGISPKFIGQIKRQLFPNEYSEEQPFQFLYVSTIHSYKYHVNVVKAVYLLKNMGFAVVLHLVGGVIFEPAGKQLMEIISVLDPTSEFIHYHGHQPYDEIQNLYHESDGIIFASSCENMPNILVESMASGLPIACSNYQPMPEFLEDGGFYFDPKSVDSIVFALKELLNSPEIWNQKAKDNLERVKKYSWEKTARETFQFIVDVADNYYVQK